MAALIGGAFTFGTQVDEFFGTRDSQSAPTQVGTVERKPVVLAESVPQNTATDVTLGAGLFAPGDPFPVPFRGYKLGTKMSVFLAVFPDADRSHGGLFIDFPEGPFEYASYEFGDDRIDPVATSVSFYVRGDIATGGTDQEASTTIWREVLAAFQTYPYESSIVNKAIYWDDVNGYKLTLYENSFDVELAE